MTNEQEHRIGRWFFQRLQDRVGGIGVEIVHRIDNGDAHAAFARRQREEPTKLARIVHGDFAPRFAAIVKTTAQYEEIWMRQRRNAPRNRIIRIDIERARADALGAQRNTGETIRKRGFAQAFGASDQPGVVHAPAA